MNEEFLAKIIELAVADEKISHIPAEVTVGQAITESGWGQSKLARLANNYFGIKASPDWPGATIVLRGYEYIPAKKRMVYENMYWRKYRSMQESVQDHSRFLHKPRYSKAFSTVNYEDFLRELQHAGYATDPQYAAYIISVVRSHNIQTRIREERLRVNSQ